jgi:DNA gyrase/topoisomerase IV subunit B
VKEKQKHVSFVNKINTSDGGTHVDMILDAIVDQVRHRLEKKIQLKPQ